MVVELSGFSIVVTRDDALMGSVFLGCNLQVQEVVFLADFRCAKCQQRVAEVMSKMNGKHFFLQHFIFLILVLSGVYFSSEYCPSPSF